MSKSISPALQSHWKAKEPLDRWPNFFAPVGTIGTVIRVTEDEIHVRMDTLIEGAGEWDNCFIVYESDTGMEYIPGAGPLTTKEEVFSFFFEVMEEGDT